MILLLPEQILRDTCLRRNISYLFFPHQPVRLNAYFDSGPLVEVLLNQEGSFVEIWNGWTAFVHRWEEPFGEAGD